MKKKDDGVDWTLTIVLERRSARTGWVSQDAAVDSHNDR
jgi:hypothetical protein